MSDPYLSVVIVGRNDDYGVDFMARLNTFVRSLDRQVKNHPRLVELIVVEWNPLPDRQPLAEVLTKVNNLCVRIITVPNAVHEQIGHTSPVLEYYGKNVGIRRARGRFVLTTNPDIIFTDHLINEIARNQPPVVVQQPPVVVQQPTVTVQPVNCSPWTETQNPDGTITRTRTCAQ